MPQNGEINRRFRSFRDNVPRLRDTFGIATGILPCQAWAVEQTLSEKRAQSNRRAGARAAVGNVKPYSTCPDCLDNN